MLNFFKNLSLPRTRFVALLAGALNVLAFAPFFIWPIQLFSLAALFLILTLGSDWNIKQAASLGFCYAFGLMFAGVCWLTVAMTHYGGMPMLLALIALALLASYMSMFAAAFAALGVYLRRRWRFNDVSLLLLVLPPLWCVFEWLRGMLFTGFPWLSFGYAHNLSPLAGYAPILGVYGLSLLVALLAGALALAVLHANWRIRSTAIFIVVLCCGFGLQQIAWTVASGQALSVRLIQTNVNQGEKFDAAYVERLLDGVTRAVLEKPADLIAIPETAIPFPIGDAPPSYLSNLAYFAQTTNSHLVLGTVTSDAPNVYANSIVGLGAEQQQTNYRYDKHHLVPFGEFVPFGFRWFVDLMRIPLGELASPKTMQGAMQVKDQWVMPNICYEDLFGDEIAQQLWVQSNSKTGAATILLNVSNLAWYDDSIAIPQHLQISQMRALETGRPMLRSTNTGATAIIDAHGKVVARLASLSKGSLEGSVQGMTGLTPYIRFGEWLWMCVAGLSLFLAYYLGKHRAP